MRTTSFGTFAVKAFCVDAKNSNADADHPRQYQLEILEKAKNDNIIAVLNTGIGKTLIATLLLRYMAEKEAAVNVRNFSLLRRTRRNRAGALAYF